MVDLHEKVNIAHLMLLGGIAENMPKAVAAICHGNVYIERWNIGVGETVLPRWVLRGVTITNGGRSMTISDDGSRILRSDSVLQL